MADSDRVVVTALYPGLRRFAAVVSDSDMDPDDVLHDAIVRTIRARSLSELRDPAAYLKRAIMSVVANDRRRRSRRRRATTRIGVRAPTEPSYPSDVADLELLEPRDRAVMYLTAIAGYTHAEVAAEIGLREANVRKIASRSRQKLRALVGESP